MERLISEQTFAMRRFSAERVNREAQSRIGFAWAPRSASGEAGPGFTKATEKLLRRMADSILVERRTRRASPTMMFSTCGGMIPS